MKFRPWLSDEDNARYDELAGIVANCKARIAEVAPEIATIRNRGYQRAQRAKIRA